MRVTPESKTKKKLHAYLNSIPDLFWYSATAGVMSIGGIPDIVGCHCGQFFAIEVKAPGRRKEANRGASSLQMIQMGKIRMSGGMAMVFDGGEDDWDELKRWVEGL